MANLTLYDLAVLQRNDPYTGLIEDVTTMPAEFTTISSVARERTWYEVVNRVTLPTAQFRQANIGVTPSKSVYKKQVKEMFYMDVLLNVDEAIWKADDASTGAVWQHEAEGAMRAGSILLGQQTYYGTSADQYGFAGVRSQLAFTKAAGGTSNSTSAYLLWMDPKEGVRFDVGKNGQFSISPPMRQQVPDPNNTGKFITSYVGNLSAWVGLSVNSLVSAFAVTGVTTHVTSSVLDQALSDDNASQLIAQIPVARRNNLRWFINRTAESVLQRTRSTVNQGFGVALGSYQAAGADGRPAFSPLPNQLGGHPITLTDSILNTETNS